MNCKTVDVMIPVYKPDERLPRILELLEAQTYTVSNIYIINTEQKYWDKLEYIERLLQRHGNIHVEHISRSEFDHGATRRSLVTKSDADYFVMMTQDALPYDETLVEKLIALMNTDTDIAAAYARQLANPDATVTEQYVRRFNYPEEAMIKSLADMDRLGIKTFFCSNVCAVYRRAIYDELGGFIDKTIFNEDMIYAASAIKSGYKIGYAAEAKVYHSHNYNCMQQLHRNFDLAVSQAEHPEVFSGLKSEGEGFRLVKDMSKYLKSIHKSFLMPGFFMNCAFRYLGFRLGKKYNLLPKGIIMKLTSNKAYWE